MTALGSPHLPMLGIALLLAVAAVVVLTRQVASGMAVYARRIIGTMLGAGAIMLGEFAFVLQNSGAAK